MRKFKKEICELSRVIIVGFHSTVPELYLVNKSDRNGDFWMLEDFLRLSKKYPEYLKND